MSRLLLYPMVVALLVGCDQATDPVETSPAGAPALAAAGHAVDPGALTPAPPPQIEAQCRADGRWIVCRTTQVIELLNEPLLDLPVPCGTLYETSTDVRHGIRWYAAADSVIVKRHVTQAFEGTWSLSPDGNGSTVRISGHGNWQDGQYADPEDLDSGVRSSHGELTVQAPGSGVIAHVSGLDAPDGTHHGAVRDIDDPAVAAELCEALTE